MYVNVQLLASKGLSLGEFGLLVVIRQNRTENLAEYLEEHLKQPILKRLHELSLVEEVKTGKTVYQKIRLSKKGSQWLEDLGTPEILQDDLILFDWLSGVYKNCNKEVGNSKKTKTYIALFRAHSQINKNKLAFLCKTFLDDVDQMEYSNKLEFLFYRPPTVYSVRFDIFQSRLYQYYLNKKSYFDRQFQNL